MSSTGDRQVETLETGDDFHATSRAWSRSVGSKREAPLMADCSAEPAPDDPAVMSCTPWMSTPAAKRSELRPNASAVR
jgi:hypothetical protein